MKLAFHRNRCVRRWCFDQKLLSASCRTRRSVPCSTTLQISFAVSSAILCVTLCSDLSFATVSPESSLSIDNHSQNIDIQPTAPSAITPLESTTDIDEAQVGILAWIYAQPIESENGKVVVFVEQVFEFNNLSERTWITPSMRLRLPVGAKDIRFTRPGIDSDGFTARPTDIREISGNTLIIGGEVVPGNSNVSFQYEISVPKTNVLSLFFPLLPFTEAVQLISAFSPEYAISAPGFTGPEPFENPEGRSVQIFRRLGTRSKSTFASDAALSDTFLRYAVLRVSGLRRHKRLRWLLFICSAFLMIIGFATAWFIKRRARRSVDNGGTKPCTDCGSDSDLCCDKRGAAE